MFRSVVTRRVVGRPWGQATFTFAPPSSRRVRAIHLACSWVGSRSRGFRTCELAQRPCHVNTDEVHQVGTAFSWRLVEGGVGTPGTPHRTVRRGSHWPARR